MPPGKILKLHVLRLILMALATHTRNNQVSTDLLNFRDNLKLKLYSLS